MRVVRIATFILWSCSIIIVIVGSFRFLEERINSVFPTGRAKIHFDVLEIELTEVQASSSSYRDHAQSVNFSWEILMQLGTPMGTIVAVLSCFYGRMCWYWNPSLLAKKIQNYEPPLGYSMYSQLSASGILTLRDIQVCEEQDLKKLYENIKSLPKKARLINFCTLWRSQSWEDVDTIETTEEQERAQTIALLVWASKKTVVVILVALSILLIGFVVRAYALKDDTLLDLVQEIADLKKAIVLRENQELMISHDSECPDGWVEASAAQGFLLMGRPNRSRVGKQLHRAWRADEIGRLARHTHSIADGGHTDDLKDTPHSHSVFDHLHGHNVDDPAHSHGMTFTEMPQSGSATQCLTNPASYTNADTTMESSSSRTCITVEKSSSRYYIFAAKTGVQIEKAPSGITIEEQGDEHYPLLFVLVCRKVTQ